MRAYARVGKGGEFQQTRWIVHVKPEDGTWDDATRHEYPPDLTINALRETVANDHGFHPTEVEIR